MSDTSYDSPITALPYPDPPLAAPGFVLRPYRESWQAVRLLGDWAFTALQLTRLQLRIAIENEASHAVASRAGYEREGVLRAGFIHRGTPIDVVMYSRLPTDP